MRRAVWGDSRVSGTAASAAAGPSSSGTCVSRAAQQCRACIALCAAAPDPVRRVSCRSRALNPSTRANCRRARGALCSSGRACLRAIWAALRMSCASLGSVEGEGGAGVGRGGAAARPKRVSSRVVSGRRSTQTQQSQSRPFAASMRPTVSIGAGV